MNRGEMEDLLNSVSTATGRTKSGDRTLTFGETLDILDYIEDLEHQLRHPDYRYKANWLFLKDFVRTYRFEKTGKNEDGEYQVAISVSDILKAMNSIEKDEYPKI